MRRAVGFWRLFCGSNLFSGNGVRHGVGFGFGVGVGVSPLAMVEDVSFLFLLLCARGNITPGGGWLYRAIDLAGSVGFVFRPSASWPAVTNSILLFQVCFMDGRCVFIVQAFVYRCEVGNDSCGSSNVWHLRATGKVDLWRLWWLTSAGRFSGEGCALERWNDLYAISLFPGCLLAKSWGCICNFIVPSF
jgi:hypothetical protein